MASEQSDTGVLHRLRRDWLMYLLATVPIGGVVVAAGSMAYVITEEDDNKYARSQRGEAIQASVYGAIMTVLWLLSFYVLSS